MTVKHPYTPGPGHLVQTITQLRKSLPAKVSAETLKKLGIAKLNESYVMNVLRFLNIVDDEGKVTDAAQAVFTLHNETDFHKAFGKIVKNAYGDLFELHKEDTWQQDKNTLISYFRVQDKTTAIVGRKQASTFLLLAAYSGHGDIPGARKPTSSKTKVSQTKKTTKTKPTTPSTSIQTPPSSTIKKRTDVGLTVRIEINLPSEGDQATYDRIFRSIRENFIDA